VVENSLTKFEACAVDKAVSRTAQMKLSDCFCKTVVQYFTTVCSVLHVNTTANDLTFLFVFFSSDSRKHDTASGNPNETTLLTLASFWPSTKMEL